MTALEQLIIEEAPTVIGLIVGAFKKKNPTAPVPTSEDVIAGFEKIYTDSKSKDAMLRATLQAEIDAQKKGG